MYYGFSDNSETGREMQVMLDASGDQILLIIYDEPNNPTTSVSITLDVKDAGDLIQVLDVIRNEIEGGKNG